MCMQCMATAMTVGAGATGMRAWFGDPSPTWLTARRLKLAHRPDSRARGARLRHDLAPNGTPVTAKAAPVQAASPR